MIKAMDLWVPGYMARKRIPPDYEGKTHIMLAVCDHFEPYHQTDGSQKEALRRLDCWQTAFPKIQEGLLDADGNLPRHTFFFPVEQYDREVVAKLAELCQGGGGEAEIHLHHEGDTADSLKNQLEKGRDLLASHGLLGISSGGSPVYGFVHGNWALCNSHPEGRACGVDNELSVLKDTGCYADFTMPSAPDRCQSRKTNAIYYSKDIGLPRAHDKGEDVRVGGSTPEDSLLLVQGPLCFNWYRRKVGILPRVENADLTGANPPTFDRFRLWKKARVHVSGRPDWIFIKLHTHGCKPSNMNMLLGEPMKHFYQSLVTSCSGSSAPSIHFVTAREMANIIHAAEAGAKGAPGQFRDYRYRAPVMS
jgi:hypothetical protein